MSAINTDDLQRRFKAGIGVDVEEAALALPFVLDALDAANAKMAAVRSLIGKYQEFDKGLDVRHSAMLSAARNSTILAAMDGADGA